MRFNQILTDLKDY